MSRTIKSVFDEICSGLVIDKNWATKLARFRLQFTLRNDEHIEFFGGNLFGVNVVRFTPSDRAFLFEELLETDELYVENELEKLPTIIKKFQVTSDAFNNACIWLLHRIKNEKDLDSKTQHQAMMDVGLIMNYRFFTSLIFGRFKYPANREVATLVYASLSRKFAIKRLGNWNAVFNERVSEIIAKNSIHYRTILYMDDDLAVRYAISDIQGRLRSMATLLMREHMLKSEENERITTSSSSMEHDGQVILKDRERSLSKYLDYIKSVVSDGPGFIKLELVSVIEQLMPTMPPKHFSQVLSYFVSNSNKINRKESDDILDATLIHAFGYLFQNRQLIRSTNDLPQILGRLKGTYSSSRNTDQDLMKLKTSLEKIVKRETRINHAGNIAAIRTGVLLYIVARSLTKEHYSS